VNIANGVLIYSNTLPSQIVNAFAFTSSDYDHRLVLGPDGYVWLPVHQLGDGLQHHTYIYRINPTDCSMTNMFDLGVYNTAPSGLMFNGGDLYLYGGTNLYRIQGLLIPVGLTQPQALHVVPPVGG
jgi:hypothetical protein